MNLSEKLIHLRKEKKLSQLQLAEILGVSRQAVSKWESGNTMPDITNIIELGRFYHVSLDYLLNCNYLDEHDNNSNLSESDEMVKNKQSKVLWVMFFLFVGFILGVTFVKIVKLF